MNTQLDTPALTLPLGDARTTFIEASAGTGKTHALTTLVARLVVEEDWALDHILVVTFTRAATAELRDRIRRTLTATRDALKACDPTASDEPVSGGREDDPPTGTGDHPQARELLGAWNGRMDFSTATRRLEAALHDVDRAHVYTIHGFCQHVLADLAFESGFPFGFEVSGDDGETIAAAVRDCWRRRLYPASVWLMRHAFENNFLPDKLAEWVPRWRAKTGVVIQGGAPLPESIEEREAAWCAVFEATQGVWQRYGDVFREEMRTGEWLHRGQYKTNRTEQDLAELTTLFDKAEPRLPTKDLIGRYGRQKLSGACKKNADLPERLLPLFEAFDSLEQASGVLRTAYDQWLRWTRREILDEVRTTVRRRVRDDRLLGYDDLLIELEHALDGEAGTRLVDRVRHEFPCALIDEYQDTDPVQTRIFQRIYGEARPAAEAGASRCGPFIVVGDPKQSIYRFRGADVFAYIAARRSAPPPLYLDRNWRSVSGLVEAVNTLFDGAAPFVTPEIEYRPVAAARDGENPLRLASDDGAPMQFRLLPRGPDDEKPRTKKSVAPFVADTTADEIVRLLESADRGEAPLDGRPLTGADVAVLVRVHRQGRLVADALRKRRVGCVEIDDTNVFQTREAEQIERFLWALVEPHGETRVRGALAGDVFGLDARELFDLQEDEDAWNAWTTRLAAWRAEWEARGIGPLLLRLLEKEGAARLLAQPDGVRRLTNVRHLADLLQDAEMRRRAAPAELAAWLNRRRTETGRGDEETQLRLESDERLVRILTVHGAKGLEFPIVFCPFVWDVPDPNRGGRNKTKDVTYHLEEAQEYREVLDLAPDAGAEARTWLEEFSESVRLLYVALTRAQYRCVVTWGQINDAGRSPLAWLLHRDPGRPEAGPDADVAALAATEERFEKLSPDEWRGEVEAYARRCPDAISTRVLDPDASPVGTSVLSPSPQPALAARELRRPLRRTRQITSFSALSAGTAPSGRSPDAADFDRPDHDQHEEPGEAVASEASADGRERTAFTFPRGPTAGSCLHRIFERLDEESASRSAAEEAPDLDAICREALEDFGIGAEWLPVVHRLVTAARAVHLEESADGSDRTKGFRLGDPLRRLVELEFHFPVAGLDRERLGACLAAHGYPNPFPGVHAQDGAIDGFLRGFVDLVVEHEGRWYVVDYKSNWLGPTPDDYAPPALEAPMRERGYTLQYLIYLVALHRYLALRLPDYDPERHIGGAFYLFVRGIDPAAGITRGVYGDRPSSACLRALDDCFRGSGA